MASNAYFAYVFAAAWPGGGRQITPEGMGQVMTDVLESRLLRTVFGMTDLNRTPKKWEQDMRKQRIEIEREGHGMHEYYANNSPKLKKAMNGLLKPIAGELASCSGKAYDAVYAEIWEHYEKNMLQNFPYIGGDDVSGTGNLTGAYCFVSMGEVLKTYGVGMEEIGRLMVLAYERRFNGMPGIVKTIAHKFYTNIKSLNKKFQKKDAQNAANAAKYPGSFETKTMNPPEDGYDFSYHNLVCPLADFARAHGYEEYMPYLCNLDYVMFSAFGVPLFREHTCFEDGDYCDFKLKLGAEPMAYWPPVFAQGRGYK